MRGSAFALLWIFSSAFLAVPTTVATTPSAPPSDIALLKRLNAQLMHWFYSLSRSFDTLAANEDRRSLRLSLVDLNKAIYDLESNGRYLRDAISRKPVVYEDITRAIVDTRAALGIVATRLHSVGLALRAEHRSGGADAEQLIADATSRRSLWLSDLAAAVANHNIPPELVREGNRVLSLQGTASMNLGEVIEKLGTAPLE
jgi:hypothetical protein